MLQILNCLSQDFGVISKLAEPRIAPRAKQTADSSRAVAVVNNEAITLAARLCCSAHSTSAVLGFEQH